MKGSEKVKGFLVECIAGELAARDQYFIHGCMYHEWQLEKLAKQSFHEMEHETEHARDLIERLLLLEGTPNMTPNAINVGSNVVEMLTKDLELELSVREHLKQGIAICEEERDYVTRDILIAQLEDTEEDHAHFLEQQLRLIEMMGLENYIQSQV